MTNVRRIVRPQKKTPDTLTTIGAQNKPDSHTKTWDYGLYHNAVRQPVALGIDASYTGFGLAAIGQDGTAKVWVHKGHYTGSRRLQSISRWLLETISGIQLHTGGIEHICMENYSFGSTQGREMAGELGGVAKVALMQKFGWTVPTGYPTLVAISSLKKYVIGKGSGEGTKKEDMKLAVYKRWGFEHPNDNVVDAYSLARIAHQHIWPAEVTTFQQEVIDGLKWNTEFPESG